MTVEELRDAIREELAGRPSRLPSNKLALRTMLANIRSEKDQVKRYAERNEIPGH